MLRVIHKTKQGVGALHDAIRRFNVLFFENVKIDVAFERRFGIRVQRSSKALRFWYSEIPKNVLHDRPFQIFQSRFEKQRHDVEADFYHLSHYFTHKRAKQRQTVAQIMGERFKRTVVRFVIAVVIFPRLLIVWEDDVFVRRRFAIVRAMRPNVRVTVDHFFAKHEFFQSALSVLFRTRGVFWRGFAAKRIDVFFEENSFVRFVKSVIFVFFLVKEDGIVKIQRRRNVVFGFQVGQSDGETDVGDDGDFQYAGSLANDPNDRRRKYLHSKRAEKNDENVCDGDDRQRRELRIVRKKRTNVHVDVLALSLGRRRTVVVCFFLKKSAERTSKRAF
jgi:hypothetical protein